MILKNTQKVLKALSSAPKTAIYSFLSGFHCLDQKCLPSLCHSNFGGKEAYHLSKKKNSKIFGI